jgi:hypothetical protein
MPREMRPLAYSLISQAVLKPPGLAEQALKTAAHEVRFQLTASWRSADPLDALSNTLQFIWFNDAAGCSAKNSPNQLDDQKVKAGALMARLFFCTLMALIGSDSDR